MNYIANTDFSCFMKLFTKVEVLQSMAVSYSVSHCSVDSSQEDHIAQQQSNGKVQMDKMVNTVGKHGFTAKRTRKMRSPS